MIKIGLRQYWNLLVDYLQPQKGRVFKFAIRSYIIERIAFDTATITTFVAQFAMPAAGYTCAQLL